VVWGKDISWIEILYIVIFLATYAYFFFRLRRLTQKIGSGMRAWSIKFVLRSVYLGLLITAILAPSFGVTEMEQKAAGKDIYFCVDLSKSMDAGDIIPSRLDKSKNLMLRAIEAMPSNRIGLIVFSSEAYVQIPLTFDTEVLKYALEKLNTSLLPTSGTNIVSAIKTAQERIQDGSQREKLMVLVTDGEDFGDVEKLDQKITNLHSIIIGVGTDDGFDIEVDNQIERTFLNREELNRLADKLKAPLYYLSDVIDPTQDLISYIDNLKPNSFNERTVLVANNKYRYFLIPAILLIMIDIIFVIKIFRV